MVRIEDFRSAFAERLHDACSAAGILPRGRTAQLARMTGVTAKAAAKWLAGETMPAHDKLETLAAMLGVRHEWLALGGGDMYQTANAHGRGEPPKPSQTNVTPAVQPHRKPREYPLISWIAAGERAESPDNYLPGDGEEMIESTENAGERGYWLTVKGLSMKSEGSPSFPPGIRILVRPEGYDVISGKFYIAKHISGETTFKQYSRDAGSEYLVPLNPAFGTVRMDDDWHIIGRVVDAKIPGL